jgi:branched-chain amino acid transport system permease protein
VHLPNFNHYLPLQKPWQLGLWLILLLVLCWLPLSVIGTSRQLIHFIMQVGISSVAILSFQWLMGRMGLLSFGHAVYVGLGSYFAIYILQAIAKWPVLEIFPVVLIPLLAGFMVALFAIILAYPSTLKTGVVFAMLSLTVAELIHVLAPAWPQWFGGEAGLSANRVYGNGFWGWKFASSIELYYLILVYAIAAFSALAYINKTPLGMAINAVKSNPIRAQAMGWNDHKVRQIAFVIAGFWAGVAGALQALLLEFVSADVLSGQQSGQILLFALLGGIQSAWGAFSGAFLWVFANSYLSHISPAWLLYLGLLFMLVVLYGANGVAGFLSNSQLVFSAVFKRQNWTLLNLKKAGFCLLLFAFICLVILAIEQLYQPIFGHH